MAATTLGGREIWNETVAVDLRNSGNTDGMAAVVEILRSQVQQIPDTSELISVEVGLPGYVAREVGVVTSSRMLDWTDLPLREGIRAALVDAGVTPDVHVGITNDCQLAALHASRVEVALPPDAVMVYLGGIREVGSGVIIDGRMFGGAHGSAGDIAHHPVAVDGRDCWCGRTGCLATVLGPIALLSDGGLMSAEEAEQLVCDDPESAFQQILAAAAAGDEQMLATLTQAGESLGQVVDATMGTLNPHAVVLGGFLGRLADYLMPQVEQRVARHLSSSFDDTAVVAREMLPTRVVGGAMLAARDACLADPLRLTRIVAA